ncbi:MAG TPA: sugar ABC transporter permease [Gaiellaceae bacterium]|nr:sugar ABC transporter permease [Gaiellaceae bacterium]
MSDRRQLALMLAPYAFGLAVLVALPAAITFALALTDYDLVRSPSFVGLDNFRELLDDRVFGIALVNSFVFAAVATPLRLLVALGLALLFWRRSRGVGVGRAMIAVPTVVPEVAYGLLWLWLLNPLYGPVNGLLTLGGESGNTVFDRLPPQWLTDPNHARAGIVLMSLFTVGEAFVVLLVARQAVSTDLYELASLEDAPGWDVFRRITLPVLAPVLVLLFLRDMLLSFTFTFVPALVVTEGGPPDYATTYLPLFVYREAFEYLRYGYAAAATLVMLALTVPIVWLQWRIVRRLRAGV